jgi:hypothetical protein
VPLYLPSTLIKAAQRNLSTSRAMPRLTDYLVFKRALVLSGGPTAQVISGTRSAPYQDALSQWTLSGLDDDLTKYFNPFESPLVKTGGFRGIKYASNGPDNTWGGWQSALDPTPVVYVRGTSNPKEFAFAEILAADLERHFLIAESADDTTKLPRLIDLAVWWLRDRDLEVLGIDESADPHTLIDTVVAEVGLTPTEIGALFDSRHLALDEA